MATTSITKEFFIKDQKAFERMKRDLDKKAPVRKMVAESASLKKSKEKLATFVFRYVNSLRGHLNMVKQTG